MTVMFLTASSGDVRTGPPLATVPEHLELEVVGRPPGQALGPTTGREIQRHSMQELGGERIEDAELAVFTRHPRVHGEQRGGEHRTPDAGGRSRRQCELRRAVWSTPGEEHLAVALTTVGSSPANRRRRCTV